MKKDKQIKYESVVVVAAVICIFLTFVSITGKQIYQAVENIIFEDKYDAEEIEIWQSSNYSGSFFQ